MLKAGQIEIQVGFGSQFSGSKQASLALDPFSHKKLTFFQSSASETTICEREKYQSLYPPEP